MDITEMRISDYDEIISLWQDVDGVGLDDDCDSRQGITDYLLRNPGLSFIARENGSLIGTVLCGHDGRRGYLHHLTVAPSHRRQGLAQALVNQALSSLKGIGISKCHVFIFADNTIGQTFWQRIGWNERCFMIMSKNI